MPMKKRKSAAVVSKGVAVLGAGAVALAAASYYLFGPGGKAHRKQAKGWMIKMKGEVIHRIEQLAEVTEPVYREIIDTVAEEYKRANGPSKTELAALVADLKKSWRSITLSTKKSLPTRNSKKTASQSLAKRK